MSDMNGWTFLLHPYSDARLVLFEARQRPSGFLNHATPQVEGSRTVKGILRWSSWT